MSDTELVNGLRHMADDHPCCEATILHAIDKLQQLESENAALRKLTSTLGAPNHINVLVEQWRELRADKERLDWLEANLYTLSASGLRCNESPAIEIRARSGRFEAESIRAAIDFARKEAQP